MVWHHRGCTLSLEEVQEEQQQQGVKGVDHRSMEVHGLK